MKTRFTIKDFLEIKASYSPSLSPNGKKVVFLNNDSGIPQIYLLDLKTNKIEQLTNFDDYVSSVSFSPTQEQIIFEMSQGGNENDQLYMMNLPTKDVVNLTNTPHIKFDFGDWSRDGQQIAYSSTQRNGKDFDVWIMDLKTKQSRMVWDNGGWAHSYGLSPQGTFLIINVAHSTVNQELYLIHLKTGESKKISDHKGEAVYGKSHWLPNESGFYIRTNKESEFIGIAFYDLKRKKFEYKFTPPWDVEEMHLTEDGKLLAAVINEDGLNKLDILDGKTLEPLHHPSLPEGSINGIKWSKDGNQLAFSFNNSTKNTNIWILEKDQVKQLTKSFNPIPDDIFIKPQIIHYSSFDNLQISAFLYLPKNSQGALSPAVINIHGGPEGQYQPGFASLTQYLLYNGYTVIAPNVRGSTGYGKSFINLDNLQKRMDSVKDLEYLHQYLQQQKLVDPHKVALMGASYGGFMVLAGLYSQPNLWAAGVDIVGISNFVTFLKNTAPYRRSLREKEYGSLEQDREFLESISPTNHLSSIKGKLLIIHGANDPRVPLSEAEQIAKKLKDLGREVELLVYPDEGHGLAKLKNKLDAYPKVVTFLDKYLKPADH